jgi:hypothetical protein
MQKTRCGRIAGSSCQRARGLYAYNPVELRGCHETRTSVDCALLVITAVTLSGQAKPKKFLTAPLTIEDRAASSSAA